MDREGWRPGAAMVLAAGLGLRMRPLTNQLPKPLVALAGRPLIDHVLDALAGAGIARAVVNLHHRADQLAAHLARRAQPAITLSDERDRLLDTGGGCLRALPLLGPDPFVIHNSDSISIARPAGANIARLARAWPADRMDSLLLVAPISNCVGYDGGGDFHLGAGGELARRTPGKQAPYVFTGVSIAHPRLFADAPDGPFSLNLLWDRARANGRLFGLVHEGTWLHVGSPAALAAAERALALVAPG